VELNILKLENPIGADLGLPDLHRSLSPAWYLSYREVVYDLSHNASFGPVHRKKASEIEGGGKMPHGTGFLD
jgi:hypothetical protein